MNSSFVNVEVKPDFSKATPGEKRLYTEFLLKSRRITKDVLAGCLKELDIRGRAKILKYIPSPQSWGPGTQDPKTEKAIQDFCKAVPAETLLRHIMLKHLSGLEDMVGLRPSYYVQDLKGLNPEFKVNVKVENIPA